MFTAFLIWSLQIWTPHAHARGVEPKVEPLKKKAVVTVTLDECRSQNIPCRPELEFVTAGDGRTCKKFVIQKEESETSLKFIISGLQRLKVCVMKKPPPPRELIALAEGPLMKTLIIETPQGKTAYQLEINEREVVFDGPADGRGVKATRVGHFLRVPKDTVWLTVEYPKGRRVKERDRLIAEVRKTGATAITPEAGQYASLDLAWQSLASGAKSEAKDFFFFHYKGDFFAISQKVEGFRTKSPNGDPLSDENLLSISARAWAGGQATSNH